MSLSDRRRGMGTVADPGGAAAPIGLTNFCINVKSNPRMHQNPPFSGKNSNFFLGRGVGMVPATPFKLPSTRFMLL